MPQIIHDLEQGFVVMSKVGCFFKSILVMIIVLLISMATSIGVTIVYYIMGHPGISLSLSTFMNLSSSVSTDSQYSMILNLAYGVVAFLVFAIWYWKVFVKPFKGRDKKAPTGFTFHTIIALILLTIGLHYAIYIVVQVIQAVQPEWYSAYETLMETSGLTGTGPLVIVYSGFLAPIVEELIFRGLIFRYTRYALPFWFANVWQALLFGVMHMNWVQGIYAFILGLIFGVMVHRGRGIKYTIVLHILFNLFSLYFSGFVDTTIALNSIVFMAIGLILVIFGLWLYYTDFTPATEAQKKSKYRW